jgi:predicted TIM-barrel fold metal-dependent hydrolase
MIIIDSQVHVWPPDRPERPLGPGHTERIPYNYQQLLADMDRAGVDRAILVPPTIATATTTCSRRRASIPTGSR